MRRPRRGAPLPLRAHIPHSRLGARSLLTTIAPTVQPVFAELSGQVQRSKQEFLERQSTLLDPTQKQQLLAERSRVDENIRRLQAETEGLRQRISGAEAKAQELSAQEQQVRQQESLEVPRARHTISLYANISSIRWDYSSTSVKGWVTSAQGSGMKAFEMEPHRHTDFAVTNYLWELMDAC